MTKSMFSDQYNTCRVCKEYTSDTLIKYGVRHYAHPECALKKWGAPFFDRLHAWQLQNFPAIPAIRAGLYDELVLRINASVAVKDLRRDVTNLKV